MVYGGQGGTLAGNLVSDHVMYPGTVAALHQLFTRVYVFAQAGASFIQLAHVDTPVWSARTV
jgi:alpha-D-ribose 1-methylphosphonate 5-triphosphate synthase subunit PhnH